jgi:hypothetical protein
MLGVTLFGIFLTPVFFYLIQWLKDRRPARPADDEDDEDWPAVEDAIPLEHVPETVAARNGLAMATSPGVRSGDEERRRR